MKTNKYILAMIAWTLIVGVSFLFVKTALNHTSPLIALTHRFIIAALATRLYSFSNKSSYVSIESMKPFLPIAIVYTFFFLTQAMALSRISSSEGGTIQALSPVLILVTAHVYLKEKANAKQVGGILLSVIGVMFIALMNAQGTLNEKISISGALIMFVSTSLSAVYATLMRQHMMKGIQSALDLVQHIIFFGALSLFVVSIILYALQGELMLLITPFYEIQYLQVTLFLSLFSLLGTGLLTSYASKGLKASVSGVFGGLSTVLTVLVGVLVLKENLYLYHLIGITMILSGVYATTYFKE